jgi:hypothetical protein
VAHCSIEDGVIELNDILRERTAPLKSERERTKTAFGRARSQGGREIASAPVTRNDTPDRRSQGSADRPPTYHYEFIQ